MKEYDQLHRDIHNQILTSRSLFGLLSKESVRQLWDNSTPTQKVTFRAWLRKGNKEKLMEWIRNHPSLEFGEMPVSRLRVLAQKKQILNYSRLDKTELIRELEQCQ